MDDLYAWTTVRIDAECQAAHSVYDGALRDWYTEYFRNDPHRHPTQRWSAKNISCALPPRWEQLADLIPSGLHTEALSGKSSQTIALALLGASATLAPKHRWLRSAFELPPKPDEKRPHFEFEFVVETDVLNETHGQRTSVDYLLRDKDLVVLIECKWREKGLGLCGCDRRKACNPATGECYSVMRDQRPALWSAAEELFGLPARADGQPCPLSPVYQAVRNAAAAMKLRPDGGLGVFGLIYDANNPYFAGHGEWRGWAAVLTDALPDEHPEFRFRAISWQDLMPSLVLDEATRAWAREKHRLG